MSTKAAITVHRSLDEVERLWRDPSHRPPDLPGADAAVIFKPAPGDRGTEIHVDLTHATPGGRLGGVVQGLFGIAALAKVKDELRQFKQRVETGEVPRSEATPDGERAERKLKQRPAQPLATTELV